MLGLGSFLLIAFAGTGNVLILAGPVGLWVAVMAMPRRTGNADTRNRRRQERKGIPPKPPNHRTLWLGWRAWAAGAVWIGAVALLYPKLTGASINDADIETQIKSATDLFQAGKLAEAAAAFEAIRVPPYLPERRAQKYHNLGVVLWQLGKLAEASAALKEAVGSDPSDAEALYFLGRMAYTEGNDEKALEWLSRAQALGLHKRDLADLINAARRRSGNEKKHPE
jgi:tetratricopeptide (TPR) repeat protein